MNLGLEDQGDFAGKNITDNASRDTRDDTEQNRYILARILQRAGLTVEECSTGKEALERAQTLGPRSARMFLNSMTGFLSCLRCPESSRFLQTLHEPPGHE